VTIQLGSLEMPMKCYTPLILLTAVAATQWSCAVRATSTYPSYDHTIAKYSPESVLEGLPVADPRYASPDECECPRVWYRDHWVYHCDGKWMYWHHGYWYHYPHFQVYYYQGVPHVHTGKTRSIKKK
jgi:hypothetical protein